MIKFYGLQNEKNPKAQHKTAQSVNFVFKKAQINRPRLGKNLPLLLLRSQMGVVLEGPQDLLMKLRLRSVYGIKRASYSANTKSSSIQWRECHDLEAVWCLYTARHQFLSKHINPVKSERWKKGQKIHIFKTRISVCIYECKLLLTINKRTYGGVMVYS